MWKLFRLAGDEKFYRGASSLFHTFCFDLKTPGHVLLRQNEDIFKDMQCATSGGGSENFATLAAHGRNRIEGRTFCFLICSFVPRKYFVTFWKLEVLTTRRSFLLCLIEFLLICETTLEDFFRVRDFFIGLAVLLVCFWSVKV